MISFNSTMSTSHDSAAISDPTPYIEPVLSAGTCTVFLELVDKYCVDLPKGQDLDDFHLETSHLSDAISAGSSVLCFNGIG